MRTTTNLEDGNISIGPSAITLRYFAEPEGTME